MKNFVPLCANTVTESQVKKVIFRKFKFFPCAFCTAILFTRFEKKIVLYHTYTLLKGFFDRICTLASTARGERDTFPPILDKKKTSFKQFFFLIWLELQKSLFLKRFSFFFWKNSFQVFWAGLTIFVVLVFFRYAKKNEQNKNCSE